MPYVDPVPAVAEIREGDVLELDGDLYVAVEDASGSGAGDMGEDASCGVTLSGPGDGESTCRLTSHPEADGPGAPDYRLDKHPEPGGYRSYHDFDAFTRCFRTRLSVER